MKKYLIWGGGILLLAVALYMTKERPPTPTKAAAIWRTDVEQAAADARKNQRPLLLNFSGSDWCIWCRRLDEEVFSQPEFQAYADRHLVCVLADFPRRTKLDPALEAQNERLLRHFGIRGFPTVLLFHPDGELIAELGYQPGGPSTFISSIEEALAREATRSPSAPPRPRLP